ncbi:uncharacterized protein LOC124159333 [Ischnura elegans]|uniref:uncharacterized protein LOC124159333 n=1 Tax=Ischnura elegans TaxID=197161 RepID=UPI001ED87643|nr:uncharacterized protein LOC124159333 [Ischnura elegans]XP_046391036.1 uncharacterized protein LOC124159333 [Ischnura elegans]XP_046391037.1 uncharacterized protein LOC124159333 [Ischnura elegans]XP_046391038.1 uncharacterized protein LOC124159333 [Ischnura elegans]
MMSSSVWKPLPDKENPVFVVKQPSSVRAGGAIKISDRGAIPKKQVFGDRKNTIQNLKADNEENAVLKNSKSCCPDLLSDVKLRDEDWPKPDILPSMDYDPGDYEDHLLPGLMFSKLDLEEICDTFGKTRKPHPKNVEFDSPIPLPQVKGRIHLEMRLEFPEDIMYEIPPVWVDDD